MRLRTLTALCPALLLLGLAWTLAGLRAPLPTGDEATSVLMVQSLWHDHDVAFREADLARAVKIWDGGPSGLTLFTNDGGKTMRYGRPLAYPLAALPFYGVFGLRGIALFNMALFLAMAGTALWHFREEAGLFIAGFFFASAAFAYAFRMEPEVFLMACAFFPLLVWRKDDWKKENRVGLAVAGALIGAALTSSPLLALLALPILIDLILKRRFRAVLIFLAGLILAAGSLSLLQKAGTKEWTPFGGAQRRTFVDEFPLETPRDLWQGYTGENAEPTAGALKLLPRNLGYVLAGRYTGLLPYFPFALFAIFFGLKDRSRYLLLGSLLIYVAAVLLLHPRGFAGEPGFLGSRYLAIVYPAFLFLPGKIGKARRSLVLPFMAAGLWTAAAVAGSLAKLAPEAPLQLHTQAPAFQRLPLELTLLPGESLPGFIAQTWGDALWVFPSTFFAEERHPHGVWVRGGTRSEVIVVSPKPLSQLSFLVYSLSADNELILTSNSGRFRVRFDTEGKRNGTPVELAVKPVAHNLGLFPSDHFYRFTLETTGGLVPSRYDRKSADPRNLGVFLDFTGEGY